MQETAISNTAQSDTTVLYTGNAHIVIHATDSTLADLQTASKRAGGVVQFPPQYSHVPTLIGSDGEPVLLSRVVEEIETVLDPQDIPDAFPTLSYTQIVGALAFLRRVAQFNTKGLDLDELGDEGIEQSEAFQQAITESLADRQVRRVHSAK